MTDSSLERDIDLKLLLLYILKRIWIVLLVAVVCGGVYYVFQNLRTSGVDYSATRQVYVIAMHDADKVVISRSEQQGAVRNMLINRLKDPQFYVDVAQQVSGSQSAFDLFESVEVTDSKDDGTIAITVKGTNSDEVIATADAIVDTAKSYVESLSYYVDANLEVLKQVDSAGGVSSLNSLKGVIIAAAAGGVITLFVLFVLFVTRKKMDQVSEIEFYTHLPYLGRASAGYYAQEFSYAASRVILAVHQEKMSAVSVLALGDADEVRVASGLSDALRSAGLQVCNCVFTEAANKESTLKQKDGTFEYVVPSIVGASVLNDESDVESVGVMVCSRQGSYDEASSYWLAHVSDFVVIAIREKAFTAAQLVEKMKSLDAEADKLLGFILLAEK